MGFIKITGIAILGTTLLWGNNVAYAVDMSHGANNFYQSNQVNTEKVHFKNIYGMDVVGTLFSPKKWSMVKNMHRLLSVIHSRP